MLALINISEKPVGFLRSLINGGVETRRASVLGAQCAYITLTSVQNTQAVNRQLESAARTVRRSGARAVCFAERFPYKEKFRACGFAEAGTTELYRAVSDKAAAMLAREGSAAYLYASRPHDMALRTLAVLCRRSRLVMADMPGGEDAFNALRSSLGVSIVQSAPEHMLAEAETAFVFDVPRFNVPLPRTCTVYAAEPEAIAAVGGARYASDLDIELPEDKERQLPDGFSRNPLIAEALRSLTISRNMPVLRGVTVTEV